MRRFQGTWSVFAFASVGLFLSPSGFADAPLDRIAARIAQSMVADMGYPRDPTLYRDHVIYGHNTGPVNTWPVKDFLAATGAEMSAIQRFLKNEKITVSNVVASGDTVVITSEMTGTLPDQSAFYSKTVLFVTIQEGLISRMELWADPAASSRLVEYITKDAQIKSRPAQP